jgi:DNA-binding transcriptional ArsR family regulator
MLRYTAMKTIPPSKTRIAHAAKLLKALGDDTRLEILYCLHQQPRNVGELAEALAMEQSALSHQLRVLKEARLVKSEVAGKARVYSLTDEHVQRILTQFLEHVREI